MRLLGELSGGSVFSEAYAINALGHIVGEAGSAAGLQAFFWSESTGMIGLGDLPGGAFYSRAYDLNDFDEVVGESGIPTGIDPPRGPIEAFYWSADTGMIGLGDLPGGQYYSGATAINNAGTVVGVSSSAEAYFLEAFIWTAQTGMRRLGTLPNGAFPGLPVNINERGQVLLSAFIDGWGQPTIWDPEQGYFGLGYLPGNDPVSIPTAMNDVGQVVGYGRADNRAPPPPWEPFIWDAEHGLRPLNPLIAAGTPQRYSALESATSINNRGQIVGDARYPEEAVLLDPFTLADMNCDGRVDDFDVQVLRIAVLNIGLYEVLFPDCPGRWAGDVNQDARVTRADLLALRDFLARRQTGAQTEPEYDCPGDLDADGVVSAGDLAILLAHFGGPGAAEDGDLTGDGIIDNADLVALLSNFGRKCA